MEKIKIYLLNPPFFQGFSRGVRGGGEVTRGGTLFYPICLSYATGVLDKFHHVRLVDAIEKRWTLDELLNDVNRFSPDAIVIDSNFASLNNDLNVARALKKQTSSIIILVGPPASQYSEIILQDGSVDIVASYEYDHTLLEVVNAIDNAISNLGEIKGISYKEQGQIKHNPNRKFLSSEDLDELPFVSEVYEKYLDIDSYFLSSSLYPNVQIFTGRGCPFKCTFCSWPKTLFGNKYRARSTSNIINELKWISNNLKVNEVVFEDDTFTVNKKRVLRFCEEYKENSIDVAWTCNARADLDYQTMKTMKKSGCRSIIVGFESGSDDILRNIKKGITVQQIKDLAKNARRAGLIVHGDFILGLPGETKDTIKMTKDLIKRIKCDILQVLVPVPIPGTELYRWCKDNGYLITNDFLDENGYQENMVSYPWLTSDEISVEAKTILKEYYLSFNYIPLAFRQILRRNGIEELKRLWRSSIMFLEYIRKKD